MNKPFQKIEEALAWVSEIPSTITVKVPKEKKLKKIQTILSLLDNPQESFKSIHITGSKGKSSTAYAVAQLLMQEGYQTGLFSSPHIHHFRERIKINSQNIDDTLLLHTINIIYTHSQKAQLTLTMFEIFTAAACLTFKELHLDYAVFEVGIGGLYDTTNILQPVLSMITNIEKEHTDILGDSIEEIAINKAGIIKANTPVWIGSQSSHIALAILEEKAKDAHAPMCYLPYHIRLENIDTGDVYSQSAIISDISPSPYYDFASWLSKKFTSNTPSRIILENQILSDIAIHSMLNKAITCNKYYGDDFQLKCRSEIIHRFQHSFFLDGGHTPHSIAHAIACLKRIDKPFTLVLGIAQGKDYPHIIQHILSLSQNIAQIIITNTGSFKKSNPQTIFEYISKKIPQQTPTSILIEDNYHAMKYACEHTPHDSYIAILGSFFLCATCREWIESELDD